MHFTIFLNEKKKRKKEKSCLLPPLLVSATFSQLSRVTNNKVDRRIETGKLNQHLLTD